MLISRRNLPVNIPPIFTGNSTIEWVSKSLSLLKLGLLKKSTSLLRSVRQDLYFKVILPSVTYDLILWGSCCNSDLFQSLENSIAGLSNLWPASLKSDRLMWQVAYRGKLHVMKTDKNGRFIINREGRPWARCRTSADAISLGRLKISLAARTCASLIVPCFKRRYMKDCRVKRLSPMERNDQQL